MLKSKVKTMLIYSFDTWGIACY